MKVFMMFIEHKARFFEWNSGLEIPNYYGECWDTTGKTQWYTDIDNGERSFTVLNVNGRSIGAAPTQ